jgi:hypothetical protein
VGERRAEAEVPRAVTAVGGRGMLVPPCMPRHASGVSLTLGCPPVHEESRVHGSGDGLHRRELHGVWRGGGAYRGRVRVQAVQRLLLQRCNLLGSDVLDSQESPHELQRLHEQFVEKVFGLLEGFLSEIGVSQEE